MHFLTIEAQDLSPLNQKTPSVPKPLSIPLSEKLKDSIKLSQPKAPGKDIDGNPFEEINTDKLPQGPAIYTLSNPDYLTRIEKIEKTENKPGKYYWFSIDTWDYCHYRDWSGNRWFGWKTGPDFHWILFKANHFFWRDNYAERWLYFDKGYWWWQGSMANDYQVFLEDGHYHNCDANGVLGDDLLTTGTQEVVTNPLPTGTPTNGSRKGPGHHRHNGAVPTPPNNS
jgi:hypothetical protein